MMDLALELGLMLLRVLFFVFVTVGAVTLGAVLSALVEVYRATRESGRAISKSLPGVHGFVFAYDTYSRALVVGLMPGAHWRFQWRQIGTCRTGGCGDGPKAHESALRKGQLVTWCNAYHGAIPCACAHYDPEPRA